MERVLVTGACGRIEAILGVPSEMGGRPGAVVRFFGDADRSIDPPAGLRPPEAIPPGKELSHWDRTGERFEFHVATREIGP